MIGEVSDDSFKFCLVVGRLTMLSDLRLNLSSMSFINFYNNNRLQKNVINLSKQYF